MLDVQSATYSLPSGKTFTFDLRVHPGEIYRVPGANGSGKTTLMNLIAGCRELDSGRLLLDDEDIARKSIESRCLAYMQQEQPFFPDMTVQKTFEIAKITPSYWRPYLERMNIRDAENMRLKELSGGQRQAVLFGQMLYLDRRLLLLDEPFSHMDVDRTQIAYNLLKHHVEDTKKICLIAFHEGILEK